jgi:hypothetical protein
MHYVALKLVSCNGHLNQLTGHHCTAWHFFFLVENLPLFVNTTCISDIYIAIISSLQFLVNENLIIL